MLTKIIKTLIIFCVQFGLLHGGSTESYEKKYVLSIGAIFKDEAPYLKEWIEYHLLIGVDHFYLYNTESSDHFQKVLKKYIDQNIVTLTHWPEAYKYDNEDNDYLWALSTQLPAYENAVNFKARGETKWLALLDIDEYLVSPKEGIKELLIKYDDYPGLVIGTDYFDAAKTDHIPKRKLLIESLNIAKPPRQKIEKSITKMIFKPALCEGFSWPPYQCRFKNEKSGYTLDKKQLRMNRYLNRNIQYFHLDALKHCLNIDQYELSEAETLLLLDEGYMLEKDDHSLQQYVPQILKKISQK